jgi:hypothetical protein
MESDKLLLASDGSKHKEDAQSYGIKHFSATRKPPSGPGSILPVSG